MTFDLDIWYTDLPLAKQVKFKGQDSWSQEKTSPHLLRYTNLNWKLNK